LSKKIEYFRQLISQIRAKYFPPEMKREDGLPYWREKLFSIIMVIALPLSTLIFIPNVIIATHLNFNHIAIIDSLVLMIVYFLFFNKNIKTQSKKYILTHSIYALGVFLLFTAGTTAPGVTFIQGSVIITVLVISLKSAVHLIIANIFVYILFSLAIISNSFSTPFFIEFTLGSWIAVGVDMVALNAVLVISISFFIEGLHGTILKNSQLQKNLLAEKIELKSAKQRAENSDELKSLFLANISHEIRTPLNSIVGFTNILEGKLKKYLEQKESKMFNWIYASSNRLTRTVDGILNMSQLESGTLVLQPRKIFLHSIVQQVKTELTPEAVAKNLEIRVTSYVKDDTINIDEETLRQTIFALTENAIKYTYSGHVELKTHGFGDRVALSIIDTGIGISTEYQDLLFEPFRQGSEGYTKKYQGLGLGLAVTKKYLDMNNVEIKLESELEKGTTFTLIFEEKDENNND